VSPGGERREGGDNRQFPREPGNSLTGDGNRNRRNRRNRGRDRFERGGEPQAGSDQPYNGELLEIQGLLDLRDDGYGFLRTNGYHPSPRDVYVSINQVKRYGLRKGDALTGAFRPAATNEKYPALMRVDTVQGLDPEQARQRPRFEDLTPLFPDEKLKLETNEGKNDLTPRIVDLLAPIGKGQRGLIVSPPKAGKTTIMKQIAQSIEANNPDVHLMVLLVDERPEEVTDMRRSVRGEVVASTFDRPADEHTHISELCIERAKRLVGQVTTSSSSSTASPDWLAPTTSLSRPPVASCPVACRLGCAVSAEEVLRCSAQHRRGWLANNSRHRPRRDGIEDGRSHLRRVQGNRQHGAQARPHDWPSVRLYPAIDVNGSSTRHEELLFDRSQLLQVWKLRRVLNGLASEGREAAGLELLIDKLKQTRSNDEFFAEMGRANPTS
jgi:transcription termination factor Rho